MPHFRRRNSSICQPSIYQQMFNNKSQKRSNFNERVAMSILNSPNSYGSTANARMMRTAAIKQSESVLAGGYNYNMSNSQNLQNRLQRGAFTPVDALTPATISPIGTSKLVNIGALNDQIRNTQQDFTILRGIIGEVQGSEGNFTGLESTTLKFPTNNFHNSMKSCSFLQDSFP